MTDRMTDPTTPRPTAAAVQLVREAVQMLEGDWTVGGIDITTEHAMALLAHPTLARVIAIGQAWVAAEGDAVLADLISKKPCPHGHLDVMHVAPFHFEGPACPLCSDAEYADRMQREEPCGVCALADALTDQERGS